MLSLMSPYVYQKVRMVEVNGRQLRVRQERKLGATVKKGKRVQVLHIVTFTRYGSPLVLH